MKRMFAAVLAASLTLGLSGCAFFENRYRYPCQDPKNWEKAECKPPLCTASDLCTSDTIATK